MPVCPTVAAAFEDLDYMELTLARHGLSLDALSYLVVVDAERRPIVRPDDAQRSWRAAMAVAVSQRDSLPGAEAEGKFSKRPAVKRAVKKR